MASTIAGDTGITGLGIAGDTGITGMASIIGGDTGVTGVQGIPGVVSLLDVYPVGIIYLSLDSTDPGGLFGGTWGATGVVQGDSGVYQWTRTA